MILQRGGHNDTGEGGERLESRPRVGSGALAGSPSASSQMWEGRQGLWEMRRWELWEGLLDPKPFFVLKCDNQGHFLLHLSLPLLLLFSFCSSPPKHGKASQFLSCSETLLSCHLRISPILLTFFDAETHSSLSLGGDLSPKCQLPSLTSPSSPSGS